MVRSVLCLLTVALAFVPLLSAMEVHSEKSEACPEPKTNIDLLSTICLNECSSDSECDRNQKCCFDGCGHVCVKSQRGKPKPKPKPGSCPIPSGFEICVHAYACTSDEDCKEDEKCCRNGCGQTCQPPVKNKPGSCPDPIHFFTRCDDVCSKDSDCDKNLKCCYSGCGLQCLTPEHGKSQKKGQ